MKVSIGQDSHRFDLQDTARKCRLAGIEFEDAPAIRANSDGDVVLHAVTNAISGITCRNILGKIADEMCEAGITDSREYLKLAVEDLKALGHSITHLSVSIECKRPRITPHLETMREHLAQILGISGMQIGITATSGESLTECGSGFGVSVFCVLTVE